MMKDIQENQKERTGRRAESQDEKEIATAVITTDSQRSQLEVIPESGLHTCLTQSRDKQE